MKISDKNPFLFNVFELAQSGPVENVILDGVITQTCAKKGCFIDVKVDEGDTMMVVLRIMVLFLKKVLKIWEQ